MADLKSIVSDRPFVDRFLSNIDTSGPCWTWGKATDRDGYGRIVATQAGKKYTLATHRVAAAMFLPEFVAGLCVRHTCDNPRCCNPAHLEMGTQADNIRDREARGRGNHEAKYAHLRAIADTRRGKPRQW